MAKAPSWLRSKPKLATRHIMAGCQLRTLIGVTVLVEPLQYLRPVRDKQTGKVTIR